MNFIGKININIYSCITNDIVSDDVIITNERISHIQERHPNDYERFHEYLTEIIQNPDYIIESNKPNTALILKEIIISNEVFKTVLKINTSTDNLDYKNSIITFMKIDKKEWARLIKNKKILYTNDNLDT